MKPRLDRLIIPILGSVLLGACTRSAWALDPMLSVLDSTAAAGGTAVLTIQLSTGTTDVSACQIDIYHPGELSSPSVAPGATAQAAGKAAVGNEVLPGVYRVIVAGLNATVIPSGPVALVSAHVDAAATAGSLFVEVGNLLCSSPAGMAVPTAGAGGIVTVLTGGGIHIFGVAATGVAANNATIVWTTDAAGDSQVEYGDTIAYGQTTALAPASVTDHTQLVGGLTAATPYHYRVLSNGVASGDYLFSTAGGAAPVLSGISATILGTSSATIAWNTDIPADSQVFYGTSTAYGLATALDPALVLSHGMTLPGLSSQMLYHYIIQSRDAPGNLVSSADGTFTTAADIVYASSPVISGVSVTNITPFTADVSWTTDQPSSSFVTYGRTGVFFLGGSNSSLVTSHLMHLSGLTTDYVYDYYVGSQNSSGLISISTPSTFTTPPAPPGDLSTLTIGSGTGDLGGTADIDIQLTPGLRAVSNIVVNLTLPPLVSGLSVTTGGAAAAAGMTAIGTALPGGAYQVEIGGIGASLSQAGSVAVVRLGIDAGAFSGTYALVVSSAALWDINSNMISPILVNGTLVITGGAPVRVWPNPWRADLHAGSPITFGNLREGSEIRIFTTSGYWVRTLRNNTNQFTWDLKNSDGDRVASGLYYYLVTSPSHDKATGELVIIH